MGATCGSTGGTRGATLATGGDVTIRSGRNGAYFWLTSREHTTANPRAKPTDWRGSRGTRRTPVYREFYDRGH